MCNLGDISRGLTWKEFLNKEPSLARNLFQFKLLPNQEDCLEAKLRSLCKQGNIVYMGNNSYQIKGV